LKSKTETLSTSNWRERGGETSGGKERHVSQKKTMSGNKGRRRITSKQADLVEMGKKDKREKSPAKPEKRQPKGESNGASKKLDYLREKKSKGNHQKIAKRWAQKLPNLNKTGHPGGPKAIGTGGSIRSLDFRGKGGDVRAEGWEQKKDWGGKKEGGGTNE